jgi:hypothetical protein
MSGESNRETPYKRGSKVQKPGDDDDEDQWISSGVVTPDDREVQVEVEEQPPGAPVLGPPAGLQILPLSMLPPSESLPPPPSRPPEMSPEPIAGPSSAPTYNSSSLRQHPKQSLADSAELVHRPAGHKTAPSSRPPSVRAKRPPTRPPSIHGGPPPLLRTSSFTPGLNNMAPPLMTTSLASAQITSTNPEEDNDDETENERTRASPTAGRLPPSSRFTHSGHAGRDAWGGGVAPRRDPSPSFQPAQSRPAFARTNTDDSTISAASVGAGGPTHSQGRARDSFISTNSGGESSGLESRARKQSAFSSASGVVVGLINAAAGRILTPTTSSNTITGLSQSPPQHRHSAAMSSLQAIPKRRDTPPPTLTSHFPPEPQPHQPLVGNTNGAMGGFALLPAPYLAAHMAVRAYEAPLQDAFIRVVLARPRAPGIAASASGRT